MAGRCTAVNKAGERCGCYPLSGTDLCRMHTPEQKEQMDKARAKGGRRSRRDHGRPLAKVNRTQPALQELGRYLDRWTGPGGRAAFLEEHYVLEDGKLIVLEYWQREILEAVFETLREDGRRQFTQALIGLPRKNGKSTFASAVGFAELILGGVAAKVEGGLPPEIYSCATDEDQARITFGKARKAVQRSKFRDICEVLVNEIRVPGTGAVYRVLSADAPSAYGLNPSLVLFDELALQPNRDLWDAMSTSFGARPNGLMFCTTTAGYDFNSVGYEIYKRLADGEDPHGYLFWREGPVAEANLASWIDLAELEVERKRLPPHVFQRLHQNKWTKGAGSLLTPGQIDAVFDPDLREAGRSAGHTYILASDLGLTRDKAATVVGHLDGDQLILDRIRTWAGEDMETGRVLLAAVKADIEHCFESFRLALAVFDPALAEQMVQELEAQYGRRRVQRYTFTTGSVKQLSNALYALVQEGRLTSYEHALFREELHDLEALEMSYGWRVKHAAGKHDDIVMCTGMLAAVAHEVPETTETMELPSVVYRPTGDYEYDLARAIRTGVPL